MFPWLFFSADFGDYNQFDSQEFLREYVLFPMVSSFLSFIFFLSLTISFFILKFSVLPGEEVFVL